MEFLPLCRQDMIDRGWEQCDFVYVIGDAYVDHHSFGHAIISRVLEHYGKHDAQWLSQLTHMEDPWKLARKGVPSGVGCNHIITKESMALYYGGL